MTKFRPDSVKTSEILFAPDGKLGAKRTLFFLLLVYIGLLFFNDGFIALDEYWVGMTRYLPAQTAQLSNLIEVGDVKSPYQVLPFFWSQKQLS